MTRILPALLALFVASSPSAWSPGSFAVKEIQIDGGIDDDTLKAVRAAVLEVQKDGYRTLRVNITSPGGSAIMGLATSRMLRQLSDKGVTVEVHAHGLCASACTWILASGTPGSRYIDRYTFFLVHPLQKGGMFGPPACIERVDGAKETETRITNALLDLARDLYILFTGQPRETVESWLKCGQERMGDGSLAVAMKIADKVED